MLVKRGGAVLPVTNPLVFLGLPINEETGRATFTPDGCVISERHSCEIYEKVKKPTPEKREHFHGSMEVGLGTLFLPAVLPLNAVLKMEQA